MPSEITLHSTDDRDISINYFSPQNLNPIASLGDMTCCNSERETVIYYLKKKSLLKVFDIFILCPDTGTRVRNNYYQAMHESLDITE